MCGLGGQADWGSYVGRQLFSDKVALTASERIGDRHRQAITESQFDFIKNHVAWKCVANRDKKGRFFDRMHDLGRQQ